MTGRPPWARRSTPKPARGGERAGPRSPRRLRVGSIATHGPPQPTPSARQDDRPAATTDYSDDEGNVLTLRDELSAGTLRSLRDLDAKPAASAEDRWQRRVEFLFERLAVRWTIAGLPLEGQKELLGRYRLASSGERQQVRETLGKHLADRATPRIDL